MVLLASSYESGKGVNQDLVEAYRWYTIALKYREPNAASWRAAVMLKLDVEQIMRAEDLAEEYLSKHPPPANVRAKSSADTTAGTSAFNVAGSSFALYDKRLIFTVQKRWYALIEENHLYKTSGRVTVYFELKADGSVQNLQVRENTSGQIMELAVRKAIIDSSPFPRLSEDLRKLVGNDSRHVNFTFYY